MLDKIQMVYKMGGPGPIFMTMNFICLAVVVAVIIDRAIYYLGRGHINAKAFLEQIRRLIAANNLDRAKKLCEATSAPIARVAKAALSRAHKGEAAVSEAIEEQMIDVAPEVKKRVASLWSLANIGTLIGLLGTISGLIATFDAVAHAAPAERQAKLSAGISEAMINTALGLFIAVVAIIAHLVYSTAAKKIMGDLESFSLRLENMLGEGGAGTAAAAPSDDR